MNNTPQIAAEVGKVLQFLSFTYPWGEFSLFSKSVFARLFGIVRGERGGAEGGGGGGYVPVFEKESIDSYSPLMETFLFLDRHIKLIFRPLKMFDCRSCFSRHHFTLG